MLFLIFLASIVATSVMAARNNGMKNPVIIAPTNGTYNAGDSVEIRWVNATTGFVNIQLVNDFSEVLSSPFTIALGVPAADGRYVWKVPSSLRTAAGYKVIIWGIKPSDNLEKSGQTASFTIINNIPNAVNTFKVLTPNADKQCAVGAPCVITWDYPQHLDPRPAYVHVRIFKGDSLVPSMYIAQVPADQKTYTWNVPNDKGLLGPDMYVSVSADASPAAGPGLGDNMGGNGQTFKMEPSFSAVSASYESTATSSETETEMDTVKVTATVKKSITAKVKKQGNSANNNIPAVGLIFALVAVPLAFLL
jgi:hypothetical protein